MTWITLDRSGKICSEHEESRAPKHYIRLPVSNDSRKRSLIQVSLLKARHVFCRIWCSFHKNNFKNVERRLTKGYVPLLVGSNGDEDEIVLVQVGLLNDQRMAVLFEIVAQEFGYEQQGILRIPCEVEHFWRIVTEISKTA